MSTAPSRACHLGRRNFQLIVTVDNKPFAVMINLGDEDVQDVLLMLSRLRAQMAARSIRGQARQDGLNNMSMKDINALIKKDPCQTETLR